MPTNNQKKVGVAILISDISVSDKEYYQKQRDSVPNNKSRDNAGIYLITKHQYSQNQNQQNSEGNKQTKKSVIIAGDLNIILSVINRTSR